jgi:phosphoenolpyruvate-protein kinase (PTS system EI component)
VKKRFLRRFSDSNRRWFRRGRKFSGSAETRGKHRFKDASIFEAHLLVLEDPTLIVPSSDAQEDKINVERAFRKVADKYVAALGRHQ